MIITLRLRNILYGFGSAPVEKMECSEEQIMTKI